MWFLKTRGEGLHLSLAWPARSVRHPILWRGWTRRRHRCSEPISPAGRNDERRKRVFTLIEVVCRHRHPGNSCRDSDAGVAAWHVQEPGRSWHAVATAACSRPIAKLLAPSDASRNQRQRDVPVGSFWRNWSYRARARRRHIRRAAACSLWPTIRQGPPSTFFLRHVLRWRHHAEPPGESAMKCASIGFTGGGQRLFPLQPDLTRPRLDFTLVKRWSPSCDRCHRIGVDRRFGRQAVSRGVPFNRSVVWRGWRRHARSHGCIFQRRDQLAPGTSCRVRSPSTRGAST